VLQHEHLALFRRQHVESSRERAPALEPLHGTVGPVRGSGDLLRILEGPGFAQPAAPLREAAVPQDQKEPPGEPVRLPALPQLVERANERVLDRVLGGVGRAEHVRRVPRIAIAVAPHQYGELLDVAREHRPHHCAVARWLRSTHPVSSRSVDPPGC